MIKLMRRLKERVDGDDKQEILDLLESVSTFSESNVSFIASSASPNLKKFDENAPSKALTSKSKRTRIETPESPDADNDRGEANTAAAICAKELAPHNDGSSATSVVRESSHLPLLRDLPHDGKSFHQAETNTSSAETSRPSTALFHSESSPRQTDSVSSKRGPDHFQVDSACLEMFWYLQTQSLEEAQKYLEYIRGSGPLSLTSTHKWLRDGQNSSTRSNSLSDNSVDKPPATKRPKVVDGDSKEKMRATEIATDSTIYETSEAQRCSPYVTITTVRNAVNMFFNATGLLFYVFTKDQADSIQHDLLNESKFPGGTSFTAILRNSRSLQDKAQLAELCGMAAVGLLYLRLGDKQQVPPVGLSDYW